MTTEDRERLAELRRPDRNRIALPVSAAREARARPLRRFPSPWWARLLLILVLWAPFVIVAVVVEGIGGAPTPTPNDGLQTQVSGLGQGPAPWIVAAYPPIGTAIGALGGIIGPAGLGLLGGLAAAVLMQRMLELTVRRGIDPVTATLLVVGLGANPLFFYTALESSASMVALLAFGLGISEMVRFVAYGHTRSGFVAGLAFAAAAFTSSATALFVVAAILASPYLRTIRADFPHVRWANTIVLTYPTVAAVVGWLLLAVAITGGALGIDLVAELTSAPMRFAGFLTFLGTPTGLGFLAPFALAVVLCVVIRRPLAILATATIFVAVAVGVALGLVGPENAGISHVAITIFAIALVPRPSSLAQRWAAASASAALLVTAWVAAFQRDVTAAWIGQVLTGFGTVLGG